MTDLIAKTPLDGLTETIGGLTLAEASPGEMHWLAPWPGEEAALSAALQTAHGLALPEPGETTAAGDVRCLWAGRAQAMLIGASPDPSLAAHGAVTDLSDGWLALTLTGDGAAEAMARLCPLDLRLATFPIGRTARTELNHIMAQITAIEGGFEILVMRSFAVTAASELRHAAGLVAARQAI